MAFLGTSGAGLGWFFNRTKKRGRHHVIMRDGDKVLAECGAANSLRFSLL